MGRSPCITTTEEDGVGCVQVQPELVLDAEKKEQPLRFLPTLPVERARCASCTGILLVTIVLVRVAKEGEDRCRGFFFLRRFPFNQMTVDTMVVQVPVGWVAPNWNLEIGNWNFLQFGRSQLLSSVIVARHSGKLM